MLNQDGSMLFCKKISVVLAIMALLGPACSIGDEKTGDGDHLSPDSLLRYLNSESSPAAPKIYIFPEDGSSDVSTEATIIVYFNQAVNERGTWNVTIDSTSYNRNSSGKAWSKNCFDNGCYPALIIHPEPPLPFKKVVTVYADGFQTKNMLDAFGTLVATFTTESGPPDEIEIK